MFDRITKKRFKLNGKIDLNDLTCCFKSVESGKKSFNDFDKKAKFLENIRDDQITLDKAKKIKNILN